MTQTPDQLGQICLQNGIIGFNLKRLAKIAILRNRQNGMQEIKTKYTNMTKSYVTYVRYYFIGQALLDH